MDKIGVCGLGDGKWEDGVCVCEDFGDGGRGGRGLLLGGDAGDQPEQAEQRETSQAGGQGEGRVKAGYKAGYRGGGRLDNAPAGTSCLPKCIRMGIGGLAASTATENH